MYWNSQVEITDMRNISDTFGGTNNVLRKYFFRFGTFQDIKKICSSTLEL